MYKIRKTFEGFFYADSTSTQLDLFVDNQFKGRLPILALHDFATKRHHSKNAIHLTLKGGRHTIQAKRRSGEVLCSVASLFNLNSTKARAAQGVKAFPGQSNIYLQVVRLSRFFLRRSDNDCTLALGFIYPSCIKTGLVTGALFSHFTTFTL